MTASNPNPPSTLDAAIAIGVDGMRRATGIHDGERPPIGTPEFAEFVRRQRAWAVDMWPTPDVTAEHRRKREAVQAVLRRNRMRDMPTDVLDDLIAAAETGI